MIKVHRKAKFSCAVIACSSLAAFNIRCHYFKTKTKHMFMLVTPLTGVTQHEF